MTLNRLIMVLVLLIVLMVALMTANRAKAHTVSCSVFENCRHYHRKYKRIVRHKKRRTRHVKRRKAEPTRVYAYRRREREDDRIDCKDTVRVVGDARPTEDAARSDAESAWMRATRWKYGALYLSLPNAKHYEIRCSRDSITEIVGQTMMRCELKARPCNPPFESREDKR